MDRTFLLVGAVVLLALAAGCTGGDGGERGQLGYGGLVWKRQRRGDR